MAAEFVRTAELPLAKLTRFPGNARRGNVEEIRKSIRRHGQYRAIVVRTHNDKYTILAGNHTAQALQDEGHETARCEVIECTDAEARRIALADNRLSDIAVDDPEDLAILLASLDGDYDGTGWDEDALKGLLSLISPPDLDELGNSLGDPGHGDAWPTIRICAPHHLVAAWNDHVKAYADNDAEAFAQLLGLEVYP